MGTNIGSTDTNAAFRTGYSATTSHVDSHVEPARDITFGYTAKEREAIISGAIVVSTPAMALPPPEHYSQSDRLKTILDNLRVHHAKVRANLYHDVNCGPIASQLYSQQLGNPSATTALTNTEQACIASALSIPWDGQTDPHSKPRLTLEKRVYGERTIPAPPAIARHIAAEEIFTSYELHARETQRFYERALERLSSSNTPTPASSTGAFPRPWQDPPGSRRSSLALSPTESRSNTSRNGSLSGGGAATGMHERRSSVQEKGMGTTDLSRDPRRR